MTASTEPQPPQQEVREALWLAHEALILAPLRCRYHGTDFLRAGTWMGESRCDSCKQPARVSAALTAIRDALGLGKLEVS